MSEYLVEKIGLYNSIGICPCNYWCGTVKATYRIPVLGSRASYHLRKYFRRYISKNEDSNHAWTHGPLEINPSYKTEIFAKMYPSLCIGDPG